MEHPAITATFVYLIILFSCGEANVLRSLGKRTTQEHNMDWEDYHNLEDIYGWLDYLSEKFDFCQVESIGKTFEGRDMKLMKVYFHFIKIPFKVYFD